MNIRALLIVTLFVSVLISAFIKEKPANPPRRLAILFPGHKNNRGHDSEKLADIFSKEYFKDGINISFTTEPDDLNEKSFQI